MERNNCFGKDNFVKVKSGKVDAMGRIECLTEQLKLPKDAVFGAVIVTAIGNREVCIENFRGMIEYNDCCLKLQVRDGRLCILGKRLQIVYYNYEELKVVGRIESICYE